MKAVNIIWDTKDTYSTPLKNEVDIPDEILNVDKTGKSTSEVYEEKIETISNFISDKTGYCHEGFNVEVERKDAIQYCLDNGTGIVEGVNGGETTKAEMDSAGDAARYVQKDSVDFFMNDDAYVKGSTEYAVISEMCLLDFDEWNAIAQATGTQLSWDDAIAINGMLWENYDLSPMDIDVKEDARTVKEAIGLDELSPADEKMIYDAVSKYDGNKLELSAEREKE